MQGLLLWNLHVLRAGVLPTLYASRNNTGAKVMEEASACELLWRACGGKSAGAISIGAITDASVGRIRVFRGVTAVSPELRWRSETV